MQIFNLESERKLTPCRRNLFAIISIIILICLVYSNSFDCSWQFDDIGVIVQNDAIQLDKMDWQSLKQTLFASPTKSERIYRPLSCITIALNYYFGGKHVFGYHVVNVGIHILAAIFLFLFVYNTLNLPSLKPKYGPIAYFIAFFSTIFWAINPVQTESVTYIVQRMTSLSALFYIMAMYFYVKGRAAERKESRRLQYVVFVIFSLLAFGAKENAAMLPFSVLLFDFFFIQGLKKENLKRFALIFFVLIIIPISLAVILRGPTALSPSGIMSIYESKRPFGPVERLLTQPGVILFYISLLFYPMQQRLSIAHDIPISSGLFDPPLTIIAIGTILVIVALCIVYSRKWPLICYCIFFFFMNHAIEASFLGLELCFEHRNYLPSMLLFVPVTILLVKGLRYYSNKRSMQCVLSVFMILLLVGFGNSTFLRNYDYKTEGTFWADAANKYPDLIRPHLNLGVFYYDQKNYEKALSEFLLAEACHKSSNITDRPTIQYNIGLVYHGQKNWDKAVEYYQKSVAIDPSNADVHNNLGLIYMKQEKEEKAEQEFLEAIHYDPGAMEPYKNIALTLLKQGRVEKAWDYIHRAGKRWQDDAGLLGAAGYVQRLMGSYGKSYLFLKKAIEGGKYDPKLHLYLAEIYFKQNKRKQAIREIQMFIEREKQGDLKGYVKGTAKEEGITVIQPFKEAVINHLAQAYAGDADYLMEKAQFLRGKL